LSEYGKDKQLFTNKTGEREKISTLKGKENIQFCNVALLGGFLFNLFLFQITSVCLPNPNIHTAQYSFTNLLGKIILSTCLFCYFCKL